RPLNGLPQPASLIGLRRLLPRARAATFPNRSQSCVFPCDYSEFGIQRNDDGADALSRAPPFPALWIPAAALTSIDVQFQKYPKLRPRLSSELTGQFTSRQGSRDFVCEKFRFACLTA